MTNEEAERTDVGSGGMSKNALKREARLAKVLEARRRNRKDERLRRKARQVEAKERDEPLVKKRDDIVICIDASLTPRMSPKERSRLVAQLGRIRGIQKSSETHNGPVKVMVLGLETDDQLFGECRRRLSGFEDFHWEISPLQPSEKFLSSSLIYLCPDSSTPFEKDLDLSRVYVIGGLVDETPQRAATSSLAANEFNAETRRLPITELMQLNPDRKRRTKKLELPLNIVVQILVSVANGVSWSRALGDNVPTRTGYVSFEEKSGRRFIRVILIVGLLLMIALILVHLTSDKMPPFISAIVRAFSD